ncbi:squalene/phytoene synthase family protein [Pseudosulfitobacter koreensis]|uniref:Squalene/phytoene synthase family protein n=1 Tax=Pseudosulfitobacter koreensis TaxID=2968472 RepID=A0ABT1Z4J8_9RHOB|nr:squalene/phytoene synthase family protein [Pseudosulfitobacter koreense]MCR8828064.1 squalene/phytoene synthase family protein [Pseudosulfitobacter koreense]
MPFDADLTACAALVERADNDRFRAAMAAPVAARPVLFALYAFNVEVARAPWVTKEAMIAEMRLQWWRDALEEIAEGAPVRRHEVVTPLAGVLNPQAARALDRLVAARRWDIYRDPFEDAEHFDAYLADTSGALMWAAAQALGAKDDAEEPVRAFGAATGLARFLQAVPELEAQKRIPLVDGRAEGISALAEGALAAMPSRNALRRSVGKDAQPALIEGFLTRNLLQQAARAPARVGAGALQVNPALQSLLLWRWS